MGLSPQLRQGQRWWPQMEPQALPKLISTAYIHLTTLMEGPEGLDVRFTWRTSKIGHVTKRKPQSTDGATALVPMSLCGCSRIQVARLSPWHPPHSFRQAR